MIRAAAPSSARTAHIDLKFARSAGMGPSVPTYDYLCRQCGRTTEVIHSMLADGPTTCEHCGGPMRRVLNPAGIIFKGSGFYLTDYDAHGSGGTISGHFTHVIWQGIQGEKGSSSADLGAYAVQLVN